MTLSSNQSKLDQVGTFLERILLRDEIECIRRKFLINQKNLANLKIIIILGKTKKMCREGKITTVSSESSYN
jgi:hypothetical protein